jgi:hypothetical protein
MKFADCSSQTLTLMLQNDGITRGQRIEVEEIMRERSRKTSPAELIAAYWPGLTDVERAQFTDSAEHITLDSGLDGHGNVIGGYVNHTEGFGGTFTGI